MPEIIIELTSPGRGNSGRLAERHIAVGAEGRALYVVPTQRKARQVREALAARLGGAMLGEIVVTLDFIASRAFAASEQGAVLNSSKRRVIIEDIFYSAPSVFGAFGAFDKFPGIASAASGLIDDMKNSGVHDSAELARRIKSSSGAVNRARAKALHRLYSALEKRMAPDGNRINIAFADASDISRIASTRINSRGIKELFPDRDLLIWDGFYDFSPAQRALVEALCENFPRAVFLIDAPDGSAAAARRSSAYTLARETADFLSARFEDCRIVEVPTSSRIRPSAETNLFVSKTERDNSRPTGRPLSIARARGRLDEVRLIAESIKRRMIDDPSFNPNETAVVFPALEKYLPLIREWFPQYGIRWNAAAGDRLMSSPVTAMLLAMLDAAENGFPRDGLFQFLSSPLVTFRNLDEETGGRDSGFRFDAYEFDALSREAGATGGAEGDGAKTWIAALDRLWDRCVKELEALPAGDEYEGRRRRLEKKVEKIVRYSNSFKKISDMLSYFAGDASAPLEDYFHELRETLEYFNVEWNVYEGGGEWQGAGARVANSEALAALHRALDECQSALSLVAEPAGFPPRKHNSYIKAAIQGESFSAVNTSGGVSVMGVYETRGLDIKCAYVGGLLDGEFPGRKKRNYFLDAGERKSLGIESIREDATEDRMIFHRLVCSVDDLNLSYPAWDGEVETVRSSVLERLEGLVEVVDRPGEEAIFTRRDLAIELGRAALDSGRADEAAELAAVAGRVAPGDDFVSLIHAGAIEIARAAGEPSIYDGIVMDPSMLEALRKRFFGGSHRFSASQVEMYARCPFRFFCSRHGLALTAPEEVEEDVDAADRGTIIHRILMDFYIARINSGGKFAERVTPANFDDAVKEMLATAESALKDYDFEGAYKKRFLANLLRGLAVGDSGVPGMLRSFLEREKDLPSIVRPLMFEKEIPSPENPATWSASTPHGPASFTGRIDRVDAASLPGGGKEYLIVDYKSGAKKADLKDTLNGLDFQLPLYILLMSSIMKDRDIPAGATYDYLNTDDKPGRSVFMVRKSRTGRQEDDVMLVVGQRQKAGIFSDEEFQAALDMTTERISAIASAIGDGYFNASGLDDDRTRCSICDFSGVCRRNETKMADWLMGCGKANAPGGPYAPGYLDGGEGDGEDGAD